MILHRNGREYYLRTHARLSQQLSGLSAKEARAWYIRKCKEYGARYCSNWGRSKGCDGWPNFSFNSRRDGEESISSSRVICRPCLRTWLAKNPAAPRRARRMSYAEVTRSA